MSLINDALKKAQEKRAQEAAAQTPAAPPSRPPAKDSISQPHPDDTKGKIPAPPPPPNRPQLPIPPAKPSGTVRLPPIVNYSIPQLDPAEQPATPNNERPRISSSVRYNPSGEEPSSGKSSSSGQKTFWIAIACVGAIAVAVRLFVTLGRDEPRAGKRQADAPPPPQVAVSLPQPNLPPPTLPPTVTTKETPPAASIPAPSEPTPALSTAAAEPLPAVSFPTKPAASTKSAAAPETVSAKPTAPAITLPPDNPSSTATTAAPNQNPSTAPAVLPPIYAPRAPAPVTNAMRIQNFIDRLRVTGVRISETGSKVILNDRLFSVGELVDPGLELKLVKIEQGMITFVDAGGKKYVKLYQ